MYKLIGAIEDLRKVKEQNANYQTIMGCEASVQARAIQLRAKVLRIAYRLLG